MKGLRSPTVASDAQMASPLRSTMRIDGQRQSDVRATKIQASLTSYGGGNGKRRMNDADWLKHSDVTITVNYE